MERSFNVHQLNCAWLKCNKITFITAKTQSADCNKPLETLASATVAFNI